MINQVGGAQVVPRVGMWESGTAELALSLEALGGAAIWDKCY
jgi:hypothetical protein